MSLNDFAIVVVAVLVASFSVFWILALRWRHRDLLKHGLSGTAVVLSVQQSTEKIGGTQLASVVLDVTPDEGPGFQVTAKQAISSSNAYLFHPGRQVPVRYDRVNRSNIVVVTDK